MAIEILIWLMFSVLIAYIMVIGVFIYGWKALRETNKNLINTDLNVTIVIAVRNESKNIRELLKSLNLQSYHKSKFEVIFVNDNSEDNTKEIIEEYIDSSEINIRLLNCLSSGKKNALKHGIENAKSELIITTDGDCSMGSEWIYSMVNYYINNNKKVLIGPVTYSCTSSFISKLFTIDFASLVASGAGSAMASLPLMGNGANLAFEKELYDDYDDRLSVSASGDDVFLIHHCAARYGNDSVGFIKKEDAIVHTEAPKTISNFFSQRIRWASKAGGYKLLWPKIVSSIVFLFNLELTILLILSLSYSWILPVYVLLIITKFVVDFPLVFGFLSFAGHKKINYLLFFMEFIYPIYITFITFASFFRKFTWKGRKH